MEDSMLIVGAGMAGLLAGNMLRKHKPLIIEAQSSLPNNHSAVLRFRSSVVGDVLGIPFKKVSMIKAAIPWRNPVADALAYSCKNSGHYRSDRSIIAGLVHEERHVAPPGLIAQMAEPFKACSDNPIAFNSPFNGQTDRKAHPCVISTMPMPRLMEILQYPLRDGIKFSATAGQNVRAKIPNCDAYVSLMVPDPDLPFSRVSLTGDELIVECLGDNADGWSASEIIDHALVLLGITEDPKEISSTPSRYAKINPISESDRRDFLYWATDTHGIFSLGRFATWRPGLLLDDLVQDVRKIEGWAARRDRYGAAQSRRG